MSLRVARFLYRWRRWLTGFIVIGAVVLAPRAQIQNIDNDLTAWFSRDDSSADFLILDFLELALDVRRLPFRGLAREARYILFLELGDPGVADLLLRDAIGLGELRDHVSDR